jgi:hypothetical protein
LGVWGQDIFKMISDGYFFFHQVIDDIWVEKVLHRRREESRYSSDVRLPHSVASTGIELTAIAEKIGSKKT